MAIAGQRRYFAGGACVSAALLVGVVVAPLPRASIAAPGAMQGEVEAIVYHGTTACGVERWPVKTGIDHDSRKVNTKAVVNTSIDHLRSLTAPAQSSLSYSSRVAPVETTVFRVSGYILRTKQESDSDYHIVLADSGGRTMIIEVPAPACVGSSSPFLPQIRYVRSVFASRYHPSPDHWTQLHQAVQVTGVGFWDFKHGQSGVAPNAIELHPVLGIKYGGSVSSPPPPPSSGGSGKFSLSVSVSPNPVHYGQYASVNAKTVSGASCTASVRYSTGSTPRSFDGSGKTAGSNGTVSWSWHMESKGSSGTASVSCSYKGRSKTATAGFSIG